MEYSLHFKKKPSTPSSSMFLLLLGGDQKKRGNKGEIDALAVSSMSWFSPCFFWLFKKKTKGGWYFHMSCNSYQTPWPFFPRHGVKMKSVTLSHEWHSRMSDKTTAVGYQKKSKRNDPSAHTWRYDMSCESYPNISFSNLHPSWFIAMKPSPMTKRAARRIGQMNDRIDHIGRIGLAGTSRMARLLRVGRISRPQRLEIKTLRMRPTLSSTTANRQSVGSVTGWIARNMCGKLKRGWQCPSMTSDLQLKSLWRP